MSELKEKALAKMLEEMDKKHSGAEDSIHNWLCDQSDDQLFQGVLQKNKSIRECVEFCGSKASQLAVKGIAMATDAEVFEWVREYFTTADIKFSKPNLRNVATSDKPMQKLAKKKPTTKSRKKSEMKGEQLDLLSFL